MYPFLSDFTKNPKHQDQKIWYFFCNNNHGHTEKVTDDVIINMICSSATLQKVNANLRKTTTLLRLKRETTWKLLQNEMLLH